MMTRRSTLTGLLALATVTAAGMPVIAAPAYPLPENLTPEFLRELAASSRGHDPDAASIVTYYGPDAPAYFRERYALDAEIFERMAAQLEPYDRLEAEMFRRDRALIARHGIKL